MDARARRSLVGMLMMLVTLAGPSFTHGATQSEQLGQLRAALAKVEQELETARQDEREAEGQLLRQVISVRLEILRAAAERLRQRMQTEERQAPGDARAAEPHQALETQTSRLRDAVGLYAASSADAPADDAELVVTLAEYISVQRGMSLAAVEALVGAVAEETSRSDIAGMVTVTYEWRNPDGSGMDTLFQDGELIQKTESGLR